MEKQNAIKVVIAVLFFALAGALLAWNMGLFGGGSRPGAPSESSTVSPEEGAGVTGEGEFGGSDSAFRKPD